jgi:hypothetical protein
MKLVEDMIVTSGTISYSAPVQLGDANCAMYEVWVSALTGGGALTSTLEGSNDGVNWTAVVIKASPPTISTAPAYVAYEPDHSASVVVISWTMLRLKFVLSAGTVLASASIRTFRSA